MAIHTKNETFELSKRFKDITRTNNTNPLKSEYYGR
jgi:hypothetical protein